MRLALLLLLLAQPLHAASPAADPEPEPEDKAGPVDALPRSMVPQGVIGRLAPQMGVSLLDPRVLVKMRERLQREFGDE